MEKVIRNDRVAVIYHGDWGAGWQSSPLDLRFDPDIVALIESNSCTEENLKKLADTKYPDAHIYSGCADDLRIQWIPVGSKFLIYEYDGYETIWTRDEIDWITA